MRTASLTSQTTKPDNGEVDMGIERTDVDTSPSKLSELLGSVDLWSCNPA